MASQRTIECIKQDLSEQLKLRMIDKSIHDKAIEYAIKDEYDELDDMSVTSATDLCIDYARCV
jgi:hypothetical protein